MIRVVGMVLYVVLYMGFGDFVWGVVWASNFHSIERNLMKNWDSIPLQAIFFIVFCLW
jgi:hypothetical protein